MCVRFTLISSFGMESRDPPRPFSYPSASPLPCEGYVKASQANRGYALAYANCFEGLVDIDLTRDYSAAIGNGLSIYTSHPRAAACCNRPDDSTTPATSAGLGAPRRFPAPP